MSIPHQPGRQPLGGRAFDLLVAGFGLLLVAPLMLLVALIILIESGRPIFFAQTRLGQHGRHFQLYKFRKFRRNACEAGRPLTIRGDDRFSRFGRFLEATKIDELPQLYNVLRGDMSIVGPRPESLAFEDCFSGENRAVLAWRPGIFGPSQVAFRDEGALYPPGLEPVRLYRQVLFPTKVQLDLSYYPRRTLASDCAWVVAGVLAVVGVHKDRVIRPSLVISQALSEGGTASIGEAGVAPRFTARI
jgi:lipopolysaccharide/colanic/teichoic acid biosynthesis glycosyltransferase